MMQRARLRSIKREFILFVTDLNNPAVGVKYPSEDYVFTRSELPMLKKFIQKKETDAKTSLNNFPKTGKSERFQGTKIQKCLMKNLFAQSPK